MHSCAAFHGEPRDFEDWLPRDPRRDRASWVHDRQKPLRWEVDGLQYQPQTLLNRIVQEVGSAARYGVTGTLYWRVAHGSSLVDIAKRR